tara:strand:+ start:18611 stop:19255 length:645 start_codon:yes stop_codon:yes gene_type:complete
VGDSPWDLDQKILDFCTSLPNRFKGFFIEAGAVNGVWQSNTLLLEQNLGWTGLLIEPDVQLYEQCVQNRDTRNMFYNAALVDKDYSMSHVMGTFSNVPQNYELALQGMIVYKNPDFNIKPGAEVRQVPAATLASILEELEIETRIDLLSLDVEGSEIQALDGLDLEIHRPSYILIETTTHESKRQKIKNYLEQRQYSFLEQMTPNDAFYENTKK